MLILDLQIDIDLLVLVLNCKCFLKYDEYIIEDLFG